MKGEHELPFAILKENMSRSQGAAKAAAPPVGGKTRLIEFQHEIYERCRLERVVVIILSINIEYIAQSNIYIYLLSGWYSAQI